MAIRLGFRHIMQTLVQVQTRVLFRKFSIWRDRERGRYRRKIVNLIRLPVIANHNREIDVDRFFTSLYDSGLLGVKLPSTAWRQ